MHGEYKTPSGKLVVVDFGVEDGRLTEDAVSTEELAEAGGLVRETYGTGTWIYSIP